MSKCKVRRAYSSQAIQSDDLNGVLNAAQILRQHGDTPENRYDPSQGGTANVCMHSMHSTNLSQNHGFNGI
nr:hypothetical protein [Haliscomenobacter sp.]